MSANEVTQGKRLSLVSSHVIQTPDHALRLPPCVRACVCVRTRVSLVSPAAAASSPFLVSRDFSAATRSFPSSLFLSLSLTLLWLRQTGRQAGMHGCDELALLRSSRAVTRFPRIPSSVSLFCLPSPLLLPSSLAAQAPSLPSSSMMLFSSLVFSLSPLASQAAVQAASAGSACAGARVSKSTHTQS